MQAFLIILGLLLLVTVAMIPNESESIVALGHDSVIFLKRKKTSYFVHINCNGVDGYGLAASS
jgi:hypothetical protein